MELQAKLWLELHFKILNTIYHQWNVHWQRNCSVLHVHDWCCLRPLPQTHALHNSPNQGKSQSSCWKLAHSEMACELHPFCHTPGMWVWTHEPAQRVEVAEGGMDVPTAISCWQCPEWHCEEVELYLFQVSHWKNNGETHTSNPNAMSLPWLMISACSSTVPSTSQVISAPVPRGPSSIRGPVIVTPSSRAGILQVQSPPR